MSATNTFNSASATASFTEAVVDAFLDTARNGSKYGIESAIAKHGSAIVHVTRKGKGAIAHASETGRTGIIEILLKHGADINAADDDGKTPLMYAAQRGHPDMLAFLLDNGADIHAETPNGLTVLRFAALHKTNTRNQGRMPERKKEAIRLLVERGADPRKADINGLTVMEVMNRTGHSNIARLIEKALVSRAERLERERLQALEDMKKSLVMMRRGLPAPVMCKKPASFGKNSPA